MNWRRAGEACAPVFQRESCRTAWQQLSAAPTPEDFSAITQACARAYCELSIRHAVTACNETRPLWDGRAMRDLHSFVLSRELGFSNSAAWGALIGKLEDYPARPPNQDSGGLDKDVMLNVIKTANARVKACYEALLTDNPAEVDSLIVGVRVSSRISANGMVTSSEVSASSEKFDALEACIVGAHRELLFPPPSGGGVVDYTFPYILRPKE